MFSLFSSFGSFASGLGPGELLPPILLPMPRSTLPGSNQIHIGPHFLPQSKARIFYHNRRNKHDLMITFTVLFTTLCMPSIYICQKSAPPGDLTRTLPDAGQNSLSTSVRTDLCPYKVLTITSATITSELGFCHYNIQSAHNALILPNCLITLYWLQMATSSPDSDCRQQNGSHNCHHRQSQDIYCFSSIFHDYEAQTDEV